MLARWARWDRDEAAEAQARALERLARFYSRTDYGLEHGIRPGMDLEEFRSQVPARGYRAFRPYVEEVLRGRFRALLAAPPEFIGITSGTTGPPKLIPIPGYDLELRVEFMLRHMGAAGPDLAIIAPCLPSRLSVIRIGGSEVPLGYISGINVEAMARALGSDEMSAYLGEVNRIGAGTKPSDWDRRFRALLSFLEGREVEMAVGTGPVLWMFARWLKREKGLLPGELWDIRAVLAVGVPHIRSSYAGFLRRAYGPRAQVIEGYGATEGLFAMGPAEGPGLTPFYDLYLYEVEVGRTIKMLYDMRAGETGRLVISTPVFPRYRIGDIVVCVRDGLFFRVPGRDNLWTRLRLALTRAIEGLASLF